MIELIKNNDFTNSTILPVAIADKTNVLELLFDNVSLTDSAAGINTSYRKGNIRKLNVLALDPSNIESLKKENIGLIKIDVEGSELEVLIGLKEIIAESKPIIFIEILPVYSKENNERLERQNRILKMIDNIDYEIFRIDEKKLELDPIKEFEIHGDLTKCNYILKAKK